MRILVACNKLLPITDYSIRYLVERCTPDSNSIGASKNFVSIVQNDGKATITTSVGSELDCPTDATIVELSEGASGLPIYNKNVFTESL